MSESPLDERDVERLLETLYERFHYDFRDYSMASVRRRLAHALNSLELVSIAQLEARLLEDPKLFTGLLQYLTVQVSDMFRDPGFFAYFRQEVLPVLATYSSPRLWVAGCATGEEVYSLAVLLHEAGLLERSLIYATDINPEGLRKAKAGVYSRARLDAFEGNYAASGATGALSDHYTQEYGGIVFKRSLKNRIAFSDHSLATDHVFAEVQLVLCRNVLIYFNRSLQERAVGLFRDALCRRGFLGIGSRESLLFSKCAPSFERISPTEQWYRKW